MRGEESATDEFGVQAWCKDQRALVKPSGVLTLDYELENSMISRNLKLVCVCSSAKIAIGKNAW